MSDIVFRKLTRNDGLAFCQFLIEVFGEGLTIDEKIYEHIHFNNPAGESILYGAWHDRKLIGTNVSTKQVFWIQGRKVVFALSGSVATHPDYRRELIKCDGKIETIYTRLNTLCRQQAIQEGCQLTYGFPNDNAITPTVKFAGYKNTGTLNIFIDVLRLAEILAMKLPYLPLSICKGLMLMPQMLLAVRKFIRPKPRGDFQISEADQVDNEYDKFTEESSKYYTIQNNRDSSFIAWRFLTSPMSEYRLIEARKRGKLCGYLIYAIRPYPERAKHRILCGYIVDFLVLPNEEGKTALYHLLYRVSDIFTEKKAVISTSIHHTLNQIDKIFVKAGYFIPIKKIMPRPVYFLTRSESNDNNDDFTQTTSDLGNWYLNLADNDII